jgi:hypothetical protein
MYCRAWARFRLPSSRAHWEDPPTPFTTTFVFSSVRVWSAGSRRLNGRLESLFRAVAPEMSLCYEFGKKGNAREVNAIIASMLRLGVRDFSNSFRTADASVSGPKRELWALRKTGWLSQEQIAEVNRHLHALMRIMAVSGKNGRLYAVTVVLTPLARRSRRRAGRGL